MIGNGALEANGVGSTYARKIHLDSDGEAWFFAWKRASDDGAFIGEPADPRDVKVSRNGALRL